MEWNQVKTYILSNYWTIFVLLLALGASIYTLTTAQNYSNDCNEYWTDYIDETYGEEPSQSFNLSLAQSWEEHQALPQISFD